MMPKERMRGITSTELMAVVAISGILIGIAGFSLNSLRQRYDAENQVRQLYADMINARVKAFQSNKICYVTVTNNDYQITEDTNYSGGAEPDTGDETLWPSPKKFKYQSLWNGTVVMDVRGIISTSHGPLVSSNAFAIRFDPADIYPEYDCIQVGPTRIHVGKWNGSKCSPK